MLSQDTFRPMTMFFKGARGTLSGATVSTFEEYRRVVDNSRRMRGNLYYHINDVVLQKDAIKASRADVLMWRRVLIDLDPMLSIGQNTEALMHTIHRLFKKWSYTVVFSGRGYQVLINTVPLNLMSHDLAKEQLEATIAAFLRKYAQDFEACGYRVDTSCSDLARIARAPGSINQKTGKMAYVVATNVGENLLASELQELVGPVAVSYPKPVTHAKDFANTKTWNLARVLPHLTERAATFLVEGVVEPGRHAAAYGTGANLAEIGVPVELAESWIIQGAARCTPPLPENEARRAFEGGWRKHGKVS